MDKKTLHYYSVNNEKVAARYEAAQSPLANKFSTTFAAGGKVLDIGCGSGRDVAVLHSQGFDAYGVDPTVELIDAALKAHPELQGRLAIGHAQSDSLYFDGCFDGILCCAVLMHLEPHDLERAALSFRRHLKKGGRLLISVPAFRANINRENRDQEGRLFFMYSPAILSSSFKAIGFSLLEQFTNQDVLNRPDTSWLSQVYGLNEQTD